MQPMTACIVRCTPAGVKAGPVLFVAAALVGSSLFAGGFAFSRYWIDRELAESAALLDRSTEQYAADEAQFFRRLTFDTEKLSQRIAALPTGRKEAYGRR